MNKDTMILKDGTEIELESGASLGALGVLSADTSAMVATWDKLAPDNLSEVQIKNGDGLVVGNYAGLVLTVVTSIIKDGGILTYFNLREKSDIEKRLDAIEDGQEMQNGAINDLGEITSVLAEAQEV